MEREIIIGIPKALLYYKYQAMWCCFFEELGCKVLVSPNTNKEIFDTGSNSSVDENCTSAKIFMGHVAWLLNKCDFVFIPRYASYSDGDITCVKFHGLYDVVRNTFPDCRLLNCNIDYKSGKTEWEAYLQLGKQLSKSEPVIRKAYELAVFKLQQLENQLEETQEQLAEHSNKLKVLIVAHPYNIYDDLIGGPIVKMLHELNVAVLYADIPDSQTMCVKSVTISKTLYWRYNKEIIGAIEHYKDKIGGVIFLTTFPCGPDSLVVELCMRKIKGIPMTHIVADGNSGEAGLQTRIESFIDIISARIENADRRTEEV